MTLNLLDWDEDLQTDSAEEYQALLNGLRRSQGFGLFFVQCSPFSGGKLIERLQADLTDKKIAILKFDKPIADGNVFKRIQTFLTDHNPVEILIIQGLENSLFDAEETKKRLGWSDKKASAYTWREVPPVLINLNQQRERFRDSFPICFIFLLPQYAINYLVHRAPDFFDWRSGFINYSSDIQTLAQECWCVLAESNYISYQDWYWSYRERQARVFTIQALADELRAYPIAYAWLCFEQGLVFSADMDYLAAVRCFDKAITLKPNFHEAFYNKGVLLELLGRYEEAILAYDQSLKIKPDKSIALVSKELLMERKSHYDIIKPDLYRPFFEESTSHNSPYEKLNSLDYLDSHKSIIAAYDAALSVESDKYEVWDNKGYALATQGHFDEAIACFDKATAINPQYTNAIYNKAYAVSKLGNLDEALVLLKKAIALDPKYRAIAKTDTDFDSIRHDARFRALVKGELLG